VNQPSPAIVAQGAVRRLPRLPLLLLCLAYVLPGFIGREPWKSADMTAFGHMAELLRTGTSNLSAWLHPTLLGQAADPDGPLPYWLGAWAMQVAPGWIAPDFAARLPFVLLLSLALFATWHGVYQLARSPGAQPVVFAFGGEARPADYARAVADGGLLALMGCLGLAQLSHETTPALVQLCCSALLFYAAAAMVQPGILPTLAAFVGLFGLTLSGSPSIALLLGTGAALWCRINQDHDGPAALQRSLGGATFALATLLAALLAWHLDLWHWRIALPHARWIEWRNLGRLFLWFTWPAWPLVCWTLWQWRRQLGQLLKHRHLAVPLVFAAVTVGATLTTPAYDRALLLALPALAALAAFALPTLGRSVSALIDWFTLLFFTGCAIVIWMVWIAMQTGVPRQPAANVARLAPGFQPVFSWTALLMALAATLAWIGLVKWRAGRHRAAIWKSVVLPASGATLCWLLLMTLWLPLLDFARSYAPLVQRVRDMVGQPACVEVHGLSTAQAAAFQFHGQLVLRSAERKAQCQWLIVDTNATQSLPRAVDLRQWRLQTTVRRPSDNNEDIRLYRRVTPSGR